LKIWIWLIGKARYKDGFVNVKTGKGFQNISLNRGQLLFGRFKAEEALGFDDSLIYRKIQKFIKDKMIIIKSNNQFSIITICKYNTYQFENNDNEQPMNNQRTTNEQPMNNQRTTNEQPMNSQRTQRRKDNKVNKVNKEKKEKENFFVPPLLNEVKLYFKENNYTEESAVKFFNYYDCANWKDSKGNQVKNWKQKAQSVWFIEENIIKIKEIKPIYNKAGVLLNPNQVYYNDNELEEHSPKIFKFSNDNDNDGVN
jgi:hypothetical protein